jgi:DNA-binding transcriptional LysR family regulator
MRLKNVTLVQLRTFLSLVRNESFTKAGQDLAVSPATVTSQIKQLETP